MLFVLFGNTLIYETTSLTLFTDVYNTVTTTKFNSNMN